MKSGSRGVKENRSIPASLRIAGPSWIACFEGIDRPGAGSQPPSIAETAPPAPERLGPWGDPDDDPASPTVPSHGRDSRGAKAGAWEVGLGRRDSWVIPYHDRP